jgi:hypothetical protein
MYKNSKFAVNNCIKYVTSRIKNKNKNIYVESHQQFIHDKLDNILSSAAKEYLKLEKEMKK